MKTHWTLLLGIALVLPIAPPVSAQPEVVQPADSQPVADEPGDAPAAAPATPAAGSFAAAFEAYKQSVQDFEELRSEFQTASAERRLDINAELAGYYKLLKERVDAMIDAALAEYKQSPNANPEITDTLLTVAEHDIRGAGQNSQGGDNYERALEVIDALVEGGLAEKYKTLPIYGIVAAFNTSDLDAALRYRQLAVETKAFDKQPSEKDTAAMEVFTTAIQFAQMIEQEQEIVAAEQKIRDAEALADDLPRVRMTTSKGDIVIELFENEAPIAVANFLTLVKSEFYDGVFFHRVLPRFMAQGGDPDGNGSGGPGYTIKCECQEPNARMHFRGSLSMAHAGRDTGGSQFFLTFVPTRHLDRRHTVFGRVIEGMEVLAELQRIEPGERGVNRDKIVKATVIRDRGHAYTFEKLPGR